MPALGATKQEGLGPLSNAAGCSLYIDNQDQLLLGEESIVDGSYAWKEMFGCEARLSLTKYARGILPTKPSWTTAEKAAFDVWAADVPGGYSRYHVWLYTAAIKNISGAWTPVAYKVFGYVYTLVPDVEVWVGDIDWEQAAVFGIEGIEVWREREMGTSDRLEHPRYWSEIKEDRYYLAGDACVSSATMAGTTVTQSYPAGSAGWVLTRNDCALSCYKWPTADTSYCGIRAPWVKAPTGGSAIPVPLTGISYYSSAAGAVGSWGAYASDPGGSLFKCFAAGTDITVHALEPVDDEEGIEFGVTIQGPIEFNTSLAPMWLDNTEVEFPEPAYIGGLVRIYVNEEDTEPVWITNGQSDWYTKAVWELLHPAKISDGPPAVYKPAYLRTGTYVFEDPLTPIIRQSWLDDNERYFVHDPSPEEEELGWDALTNIQVAIATHSIRDTLDALDPYWAAITLTHTEQSIDIPPGESARPTSWVGSGGATVAAEPDGGEWTVAADATNPIVSRTFTSRYPTKMEILSAWNSDYEGRPYGPTGGADWDWIIHQIANGDSAATLSAWPQLAAIAKEDVFNWDNSRYIRVEFDDPPDGAIGEQVMLTVGYDLYTPVCQFYQSFTYNFGSAGTFSYEVDSHTATFYATLTAEGIALFDLGLLFRNNDVRLQHVTSAEIALPNVTGLYDLTDITLVRDSRGPSLEFQQATQHWDWRRVFIGAGCSINGMVNLNLHYGCDQWVTVQMGMFGTQYLQRNPGSTAIGDPTYVKTLQRIVAELNWQQQLTAIYLSDNVADATVDEADNLLSQMYWWDLKRICNVDEDDDGEITCQAASHCHGVYALKLPYLPQVFVLEWTSDGVGHGLITTGTGADKDVVRSTGGSSTDPEEYSWVFLRRAEGTTTWEEFGSFEPDGNGRGITQPAIEEGYEYAIRSPDYERVVVVSPYDTRQLADFRGRLEGAIGGDVYVVEHATNIVYVLEYVQGNGLRLIYTSDGGQYYREGTALCPYALPKQLVADANTDGHPAGYVIMNGVIYAYHIKDNALKRMISYNWGGDWSAEATVIPATEAISYSVEANIEGIQFCFAINTDGSFYCYRSTTHFADTTWTVGTNKFLIAAAVDDGTPGWYFAHGKLWAYCFANESRVAYVSEDWGQTWTEET